MNLTFDCPFCGKSLKSPNINHTKLHGVDMVTWHKVRIETQTQRTLTDVLSDLYLVQGLGTPEICKRLGVTFRKLRTLLALCDIPLRSISEGVTVTWTHDNGTRRKQASEIMSTIANERARQGLNVAKNEAVRKKISAAKKLHNPGIDAAIEQSRLIRLASPSSLEQLMIDALNKAGIETVREYPVGKFSLDFSIPSLKIDIECDSSLHTFKSMKERDARRDQFLKSNGWTVLRFTSKEMNKNMDGCIACIRATITSLTD